MTSNEPPPPQLKCLDICDKAVLTKDIHRTVTHMRLIIGQFGILFLYFWKVLIETSRHLAGLHSMLQEPTSTNQFKRFS